jgi:hypothetical protein
MQDDAPTDAARSGLETARDAKDRRAAPRIRMLQKGNILYLHSGSAVECIVLDRSETGARLRPIDVLSCPNRFRLRTMDSVVRLCEVVWRDGRKIGVRFLKQDGSPLPA